MKIRHLKKVDAVATTSVDADNNNKQEEKVDATDALFDLLEKAKAPHDSDQASVVLGKWSKTALDEKEVTTTQLPKAPRRVRRAPAKMAAAPAATTLSTKEKEPLKSHHRQEHTVHLGSDGSVLNGLKQEITRLNFGVQYDNNVSVIIADFSALTWANKGEMDQYTPVISFCNKDTPETVISYAMNTSEQWPNNLSAEFYIPKEITSITNGIFLFSLQEKGQTNNVNEKQEIWVSKTVNFYTAPNIFNNGRLTPTEPDPNIDSLAYLSKNRIGIEDIKSANLGYDFSFGEFPIILGAKFDQYVKLMKLPADLMWNYECSKGFLLLKPATAATEQPTVCRFQAIKDRADDTKYNYYCMLPKEITENAQSYTIAVAITDDDADRIYWSSNQTATVINNFLSTLPQLTDYRTDGFGTNSGGLITADNYRLISSDNFIIDTIEN